ncbi:prepilin peptidase [Brenneria izbisi]|uniref:A24 family peptidase n=1 Tax=Brenneria izbisi TaxID=2939450 RepID=A0AA42C2H4_9GAMM|nr:A24 family peptidase [Brenneria izbisi]MCV9879278.1 A24 family peptidase [Brenneria izbisi]MCV9883886.1 A24 family peptidase [Brenneria izbisi]
MIFQFNALAPWSLVFLLGLMVVFSQLARQPHQFLIEYGVSYLWDERSARLFVWFYALAGTLIVIAPAPLFDRISIILFLGFMLQLSIIDAIAGWLPIEYTGSGTAAGLLAMLGHGDLLRIFGAMAGIGFFFAVVRFYFNARAEREVLGLGDVWLSVAITAWCGWSGTLQALVLGVTGFVVWHASSRCQRKEGPLGPWLCAGAMLASINRVFNPVVVW